MKKTKRKKLTKQYRVSVSAVEKTEINQGIDNAFILPFYLNAWKEKKYRK